MSDDAVPYVVRQGETLLSIAVDRGLDPDQIWNHPRNAALVLGRRRDPDMLAPNDVLYIPREAPTPPGVALKAGNRFRGWTPRVEVALAFHGEAGPMADEPYAVDGVRDPREGPITGRFGGDGRFTITLPVGLRHFVLRLPRRGIAHVVWVGHLDPRDTRAGMLQRLRNLGYLSVHGQAGDAGDFTDAETERLALWWFQRANGLEPTGFADEATMARVAALSGG